MLAYNLLGRRLIYIGDDNEKSAGKIATAEKSNRFQIAWIINAELM